ncbi:DUF1826 domain-containing protein [Vibrio sp. LaRot3]|uniref:DUF1826 domain-containing protein n=1 Tax=Vibrio sp. LaRot3 TaxID=2998829 RepID=UPI0022CE11E4|nr:DUF1826 domain-containing protein [Vibrio sp. LaRot3]MDA0150110.1 DUF1826 domain-containing protein [Vibrio sp. LaRot3]
MSISPSIDKEVVEVSQPRAEDNKASVLSEIYKPEHNIAIWQRELSAELAYGIEQMVEADHQLAVVSIVTPDDAAEVVSRKLGEHSCVAALSEDIALIVDMFCCLFNVKEVGLRLTVLDKPMCPSFHVDQVPVRLVTTYIGQATQWLENQDVDRSTLTEKNGALIQQITSGDVALLKGGGWEGNEDNALVHRSPQIVSNERRLLLTLDMV